MLSSFTSHPSSFRDPSGFLFYKNGNLYRQVNQFFKADFDAFISGGLYTHLVEKNILIPHHTIPENLTGAEEWYQTLQPEIVPFISYPYEWCFDMLKDAALKTLEAAKEALHFGMLLKDASAYNLQWHKGQMMFIDSLSFEKYNEQKPWIAYRQFCQHFFAPLALMHYLKEPLQHLLIAYPEGIPVHIAKKLLPFKSKLNLHSYLHLHLSGLAATKKVSSNELNKPFSIQKMKNLLRSLEEGIRSFYLNAHAGVWSNYYKEAFERENYIAQKKIIISDWAAALQFSSVFDAGANEGEFSELLLNKATYIVSADLDHYSINKLYNTIKQKAISNIYPLLLDLSNPSAAIGVNNMERAAFLKRGKTDLVLALALIHHLAIGKNIPFSNIASLFNQLGRLLIIEFIPKQDEKVAVMLSQKKDVYHWYTQENFLAAFSKYYTVIKLKEVAASNRTLYLMEAYER